MKLSDSKHQQHLKGQLPCHLFFIHVTTLIPKRGEIQFARTFTLPRYVHKIKMLYLSKIILKIKRQKPHQDGFSTNWKTSQQCLLQGFFDPIFFSFFPSFLLFKLWSMITYLQEIWKIQNKVTYSFTIYYNYFVSRKIKIFGCSLNIKLSKINRMNRQKSRIQQIWKALWTTQHN